MRRFIIKHRESIQFAIIVFLMMAFLVQHAMLHEEFEILKQEVVQHIR